MLRRAVDTKFVALTVLVIILAAALGAALVFPQTSKVATSTSTSTASTTTTITRILGSISTTTTTSVVRNTTTVTSYGLQSIALITAYNFTLGSPNSSYDSLAVGDSKLYVSGPNITAIDPSDNTIAVIPTPGGVTAIAANLATGMVYANNESCANPCTQSLLVINGSENKIVGTINLGVGISHVAVDYETNMVYALAGLPATVFVINGSTDSLVTKVTFPQGQQSFPNFAPAIGVNEFKDMVYVPVCPLSLVCAPLTLYEISGANVSIVGQVQSTSLDGFGSYVAMTVDSSTNMVYMLDANSLVAINATSGALTQNDVTALGPGCTALAIGFDNDIYVACAASQGVPSFFIMDESGQIINSFTESGSASAIAAFGGTPTSAAFVLNERGYVLEILRTFQLPP